MTYEDMSEELLRAAHRIKETALLEGAGCLVEAAGMLLGQERVTRMNREGAEYILTHLLSEHEDGRTHLERERDDAVATVRSNSKLILLAYEEADHTVREMLDKLVADA